jgi:hypothetical protein
MSLTNNNRILMGTNKPYMGSPTHSSVANRDLSGSPNAVNGFKNALRSRSNRSGSPSFDRGLTYRAQPHPGYKDLKQIQQALFAPHRATPSLKAGANQKITQGSLARIQSSQKIERSSPFMWVTQGSPRQGSPTQASRGSPQLATRNELAELLAPPQQNLPLIYWQGVPITRVCISHPQRTSLYYLPETVELLEYSRGRSLGYLRGACQQCAVKLAFHKVLVEEIDRTEQIEENMRVVSDWSHGLQKALGFQQEALGIITQKTQNFHLYCQQEFNYVQEFEGYINQFIYMMQTKFNQVKTQILECNQQEATRLDQYRLEIQSNVSSLSKLLLDIEGQHHTLASENQPEEIAKLIANSERDLLEFRNNAWNRITSNFTLSGLERVEVEQIAESVKVAHEWFKIGRHQYSDNFEVKTLTEGLIKEALQPPSTSRRSSSLRPLQEITNLTHNKGVANMEAKPLPEVTPKEELIKPLLSCNDFSFDKTEIWESMIGNEGINKSTDQDPTSNQQILNDLDAKSAIMNTKDIENLIEGVSKSQANTSKYYQAYVPEEPIIVISPDDNVNPDQQTPELGEKLRPSAPIQEKLSQLLANGEQSLSRQNHPTLLTLTTSPTKNTKLHEQLMQTFQPSHIPSKQATSTVLQQSELDSLYTYLGHTSSSSDNAATGGNVKCGSLEEQASVSGWPQPAAAWPVAGALAGLSDHGVCVEVTGASQHQLSTSVGKGSTLSTVAGTVGVAGSQQAADPAHFAVEDRRNNASGIKCQKILFLDGEGGVSDPH